MTARSERLQSAKARSVALVELLHLPPVIVVVLASGALLAAAERQWPPARQLFFLLSAQLLTQFAISLHNDYVDLPLDRRTKPWRALPSGLVRPTHALAGAVLLAALGLALAVPLGVTVLGLVALGLACGVAYNAGLKRTYWAWLTFWIALPTLPLEAFALAGRLQPSLWTIFVIAGPLVLSVYVADTLKDIESDRGEGLVALPHRLGRSRARVLCWVSLALGLGLAYLFSPSDELLSPLFFVSVGLLGAAVLTSTLRLARLHWPAVLACVACLAVAWVAAYP